VAAIVAGGHGNEIAGILAAYWIIERCQVKGGTLIVVPRANASAATWSLKDPRAPIVMPRGSLVLRYGTRLSNPVHETRIDPSFFVPPQAPGVFAPLAGEEARNINRQYPGDLTGNMTSQAAYAITQLLIKNRVGRALDLHEASPKSSLAWSIIARPEYLDDAARAVLEIEDATGRSFHLENSKDEFAGYSHWEWGKLGIRAFLVETLTLHNPPTIHRSINVIMKKRHWQREYLYICMQSRL